MLAAGGRSVADMAATNRSVRRRGVWSHHLAGAPPGRRHHPRQAALGSGQGPRWHGRRAAPRTRWCSTWMRRWWRSTPRTRRGDVALQAGVRVPSDVLLPRRHRRSPRRHPSPRRHQLRCRSARRGRQRHRPAPGGVAGRHPGDHAEVVDHPVLVTPPAVDPRPRRSVSGRHAAIAGVSEGVGAGARRQRHARIRLWDFGLLDAAIPAFPKRRMPTPTAVRQGAGELDDPGHTGDLSAEPHPGAQLRLWDHDGWRHQGLTNSEGDLGEPPSSWRRPAGLTSTAYWSQGMGPSWAHG